MPSLFAALALLLPLPATSPDAGVATAHWALAGDLESAVGGQALSPRGPRAKAAELRFEETDVGARGRQAVLVLGPGTTLEVQTGLAPRGPGFVGAWTLVVDLRVGEPDTFFACALLQTDVANDDLAEIYLNSARGIGVERRFQKGFEAGRWHRLAFVAERERSRAEVYLDGVRVADVTRDLGDSRYTLEPALLLFADPKLSHPGAQLAGLHIRAEAMSPERIAALGGVDGPPLATLAPVPAVTAWRAETLDGRPFEGDLRRDAPLLVSWESRWPAGEVSLWARDPGDGRPPVQLGTAPMSAGRAVVRVPPTWPAAAIALGVASGLDPAPNVFGSAMRIGSDTAPGPAEPLPLLAHGDFEAAEGDRPAKSGARPSGWEVNGDARLATIGPGYHLAGREGDWSATQRVDIAELLPPGVEAGPHLVLELGAQFRRAQRPGRFDDRGWLEATFEDARGHALGFVATLHADAQGWHPREARAPVPPGTTQIVVRAVATARRGPRNDLRVDDITATLGPARNVSAVGLRKLPVLHPSDRSDLHHLVFETRDTDLAPEVLFGLEGERRRPAPLTATTVQGDHQIWRAELDGLTAGARHVWQVRVGPDLYGPFTFNAPKPDDAPLRVAWMADNQYGWETFTALLPKIAATFPDLLVLAGDIVQNGDQRREWQTEWFSPLGVTRVGQEVPIQFARGNHDGEHALSYAYTALPGNGAWFAYSRAGVRFIFLDTEANPDDVQDQVLWLKRELTSEASRAAKFRIAVMHKPPYTNRWDSPNRRYDGEAAVRRRFVPLFSAHGVDLVVAGHAHCYQRRDFEGVRYVVVGGGGGRLDAYKVASWPMTVDWVGHHFAVMDVDGDRLSWRVEGLEGEAVDSFEMTSRKRRAARR
jgi:Icc-related predicted phosphoesterase